MKVDYRRLVEDYIALWNLPDGDRAAPARAVWTDDVYYCDPIVAVRGTGALDAYIGQTRRGFAGTVFRALEPVEGHHHQLRFRWECVGPDGPVLTGSDVALLDGALIKAVHGFFD